MNADECNYVFLCNYCFDTDIVAARRINVYIVLTTQYAYIYIYIYICICVCVCYPCITALDIYFSIYARWHMHRQSGSLKRRQLRANMPAHRQKYRQISKENCQHDDVIKWKHLPRYWPFVRGIHRPRWIPLTKASDTELWCFLWSVPE